jgi:hypothetical protein
LLHLRDRFLLTVAGFDRMAEVAEQCLEVLA